MRVLCSECVVLCCKKSDCYASQGVTEGGLFRTVTVYLEISTVGDLVGEVADRELWKKKHRTIVSLNFPKARR